MENVSEALLKELIESMLEGRNILHKKSAEINPVSLEKKGEPSDVQNMEMPADGENRQEIDCKKDDAPAITDYDVREQYLVENPVNREAFADLKKNAPCRLGIGKAGARCKTRPMLQFQAAHSAAQDAVFSDVDPKVLEELGLFQVQTQCRNKDVFLTRPDLGRRLNEEGLRLIKERCRQNPQVQIYVSDGLSSAAVNANVREVLPSMEQGLQGYGIETGTPFFVRYGRVGAMDQIAEITGARVTCVLIGERPGLLTAESMSAYIVYNGYVGIPESRRTVVSNIHSRGTVPAEAGAHIAEVIKKILETEKSGTQLAL